MKKLFLVRHAEANENVFKGMSDFERMLTNTGIAQASHLGNFLNQNFVNVDLIITSDAERTFTTSKIIAEQIKYPLEDIISSHNMYKSSVRLYLEILHELSDVNECILLVGHNPEITYIAEFLTGAEINIMELASFVEIHFDTNWKEVSKNSGVFKQYKV
ncbi:MAG: histidine phosphatase family protein [Chitinophagaceae bacterium]|nr:histidine phosphatase family protein [Chitinophagaceae bacterium]